MGRITWNNKSSLHPSRLLLGLEFAFLVWWAPKVKHEGGFPLYYYAVVVLSYALHQVTLTVWGGEMLFLSCPGSHWNPCKPDLCCVAGLTSHTLASVTPPYSLCSIGHHLWSSF